ncbi:MULTISPECIES: helix-turn-helix domain-containing protein [Vibrio]|jgi:transcriptional regulator with XRE-family HTH domain|uniref:helix-turn-helix domain-containing protein n=1 Tax=Vibrio TaxID=662 RepID=UPI0007BC3400|nr:MULTISPECIES: helix-turn-helix transcriptional regulator [Vibrio]MCG9626523.1 helix-turn-helix domain-containing protein [Vibrio mediterranei]MCG9657804.1 helix-turn-helix domain-containing protein [Vibrio mediterranei]MCG9662772.1 helix-turn-helix domain-containing protein [Vibrio mediterranei]NOI26398.1 helix-turn-helix transcriptional regulator [Vibrio mediterranei]OIN26712.1 transcriptional regulator [Vibrio barjaei]
MAEIETEGFEFFGVEEQVFRKMVVERIEALMVQTQLSKNSLAKKAGIGRSALYEKMDREGKSHFTILDFFRIAKALDVSLLQLFPMTSLERLHGGQLPLSASTLKFLDLMLAAPKEDVEYLSEFYRTLKKRDAQKA